jgi:hypothetical protein
MLNSGGFTLTVLNSIYIVLLLAIKVLPLYTRRWVPFKGTISKLFSLNRLGYSLVDSTIVVILGALSWA